ncbi:MAG: histidine kinase dimerization/phosphoacceptor domain -containing protein [Acetobacteraceae bacterium]|nr:histidine kinase dimerization/phosphoacceptor domain -containing protein [Acetobacteraceae bacterium]
MTTKILAARVETLLRREKALSSFGTLAFRETSLAVVLDEAARVCAECLGVPFSKICRFRPTEADLLVVAGHGWNDGVVGFAISVADESSPQGLAFTTGQPQLCPNIKEANTYNLPPFYPEHRILSTVDVLDAAKTGPPFGVLEVDSQVADAFDEHDIDFLTGFANILAEAVATSERSDALRRTVARMEELVEEKETLSQELKHRVRNSLHLVYGLLSVEIDSGQETISLAAVRSIALRVMGLAQVFDHLLGIGMSKVINFGDYVSALCENIPQLYGQKNIKLTCRMGLLLVDLDEATALGIIVTELVNNAYLHAFPNNVGEISVELKIESDQATLIIADDGLGFEEVVTKRRGMALMRRLVQQVGGTLTLTSNNPGSTWTINWPATKIVHEIAEGSPTTLGRITPALP